MCVGGGGMLLKQQHLGINLQRTFKVVALVIYESFTGRQREMLIWVQFKSVVSGDGWVQTIPIKSLYVRGLCHAEGKIIKC